jgi:hypothetical protein
VQQGIITRPLGDLFIQTLQERRSMNKCKTSQRVDIVEVFLNQKTDFPRGWEVSSIQPVLMSQTITQES